MTGLWIFIELFYHPLECINLSKASRMPASSSCTVKLAWFHFEHRLLQCPKDNLQAHVFWDDIKVQGRIVNMVQACKCTLLSILGDLNISDLFGQGWKNAYGRYYEPRCVERIPYLAQPCPWATVWLILSSSDAINLFCGCQVGDLKGDALLVPTLATLLMPTTHVVLCWWYVLLRGQFQKFPFGFLQ